MEGLLANPKLAGYQVYNRKATRTGKPGMSRRNPLSEWVWSPRITHEPVISLDEWKAAQEVTAGLKAGAAEYISLQQLRTAVGALGHTVTAVRGNGTHRLYQIGDRQIVLPAPIPDPIIQQVVDDLRTTP
ncbi:recombinase family protein [Amycolatopsis sp. TNS106]|uniref:recombinase family protein n=1 Tax=Amycolatopsis sp. TNS106 TaxID=2861750 RepID=UPI001C5865E4|nr:recombinase family protein [Amycolatopsis sp. TNS106]